MTQGLFTWLSENPDQANALAAIANAAVAALALIVAAASIILSIRTLRQQTLHNKLSVRPMPYLALGNYENVLRVKICNYGSGPLIIKNVNITNSKQEKSDVISWMPRPPLGLSWSDFAVPHPGRSIPPEASLTLLELAGNEDNHEFCMFRDRCRVILSQLEFIIEYTDIYGDPFTPYTRKLDWFAK